MISSNVYLDFDNVLIKPKYTKIDSRKEVDLEREFYFSRCEQTWKGVPIIAANMDTIGTVKMCNALADFNMMTALHKFNTIEQIQKGNLQTKYNTQDNFMITTGISDSDYENLVEVVSKTNPRWICIDIANGYMKRFVDFCKKVRDNFPNKIIVAGNVATPEMTRILFQCANVDVVKIGIGPGSACLTREKTGVGVPQFSAIIECAKVAHEMDGYVIADGGITTPGDACKAFCAGADFIMCGGIFAGHKQCPGQLITDTDNNQYKIFYGMSSEYAMIKRYGKMNTYRSSEGRVIKVPYKGCVTETIKDLLGGLRSCCAYINSGHIQDMPENAEFIRVNKILNTSLV